MTYFSDVAALARKDLLLELRAKTVSGDITIRRAPALEAPPAETNGAQEVHA